MAVRSKVRHSEMLTESDCWTMLKLKSTAEITEFLKGTKAYGQSLDFLVPSTTHRGLLESALNAAILDEASILMSNLNTGPRRHFFADLMLRFEADHLKNLLRRIHNNDLQRDIMYTYLAHIPSSDLPYDRLDTCHDYASLLNALKGTRYEVPLRKPVMKLISGETTSLFETETVIDQLTESSIYYDLQTLEKTERDILTPFVGTRIDSYNIYNIHRCRWYYNMTTDEIMSMLLPVFYRAKKKDLRALAEAKDRAERMEILSTRFPEYAKLYDSTYKLDDAELMLEVYMLRKAYMSAKKLYSAQPVGFYTAIGYFMIKRYEVRDITKIVELVRYHVDPQVAAKYLVMPVLNGGADSWL